MAEASDYQTRSDYDRHSRPLAASPRRPLRPPAAGPGHPGSHLPTFPGVSRYPAPHRTQARAYHGAPGRPAHGPGPVAAVVLLPVLLPAMGPRGSYNAGLRCSRCRSYQRPAWRVDPAAIAAHITGRGRSRHSMALYELIRAAIRRLGPY